MQTKHDIWLFCYIVVRLACSIVVTFDDTNCLYVYGLITTKIVNLNV